MHKFTKTYGKQGNIDIEVKSKVCSVNSCNYMKTSLYQTAKYATIIITVIIDAMLM